MDETCLFRVCLLRSHVDPAVLLQSGPRQLETRIPVLHTGVRGDIRHRWTSFGAVERIPMFTS